MREILECQRKQSSTLGIYLGDGKLDRPGECIALEQIFKLRYEWKQLRDWNTFSRLIQQLGICSVLSVFLELIGSIACFAAQSFLSVSQLPLSYESPLIYIAGDIVNHGDHPGIPGDYNVYEYVHVRVNRYKYKEPGTYCYCDVPTGIYFEFH